MRIERSSGASDENSTTYRSLFASGGEQYPPSLQQVPCGQSFCGVFDVASGECVKQIEQDRDFKDKNVVRACGVSPDCRHVHACMGPGIVWRMEHVPELDDEETDGPGTPPEGEC